MYSADSFVADEQPTTSKWNKLWSNDASFNDGTGIGDNAITDAKRTPLKIASVYRSTNQTIANASLTAVIFNAEETDAEGWHDNVTNNTRVTVGEAGAYLLNTVIQFNADSAGFRQLRFNINGDTLPAYGWGDVDYEMTLDGDTVNQALNASRYITLASSDYIEVVVYQNSGGNLALLEAHLDVIKLSDAP